MAYRFATTSWTQVLAAREAPSSESRQALEGLCNAYWYPLYAFVRRQGNGPEESRDLTQGYFAQLLEKGYLEDFDPSLGSPLTLAWVLKETSPAPAARAMGWTEAQIRELSDFHSRLIEKLIAAQHPRKWVAGL